ncbi:hypothetical protein [Microbacterium karelineae]|uniref:hypothetical protein n=1 Tax=Microbacterium karelineae TaxID=2654283 RepID=UPI0012EA1A53|nr:hypothetical protein [Microbacterium karelineae]
MMISTIDPRDIAKRSAYPMERVREVLDGLVNKGVLREYGGIYFRASTDQTRHEIEEYLTHEIRLGFMLAAVNTTTNGDTK